MNIAIFGSCVSRDTCEFVPKANVIEYVARQSVTSLIAPHGEDGVDFSQLDSAFQKRMVASDLRGTGADRLVAHKDSVEIVLIDLVDERRGFWQFPNSTSITNSLEIESCGAAEQAAREGAELVEFGTERHFEAWKFGFDHLVETLQRAQMWERSVLLDIEWARVLSGSTYPADEALAKWGRRWRRAQRGTRNAARQISNGEGLSSAWNHIWNVKPTDAEEYADRAVQANRDYARYREYARSKVAFTITRKSRELRINPDHKWGPQPFHYRDSDYRSLVGSLSILKRRLTATGSPEAGGHNKARRERWDE